MKTTRLEALGMRVLIGVMVLYGVFLLVLPSVSAYEFDNVKSYDAATKTVTYKNAYGLGADIATVTLLTSQVQEVPIGKDTLVGILKVNLSDTEYKDFFKTTKLYDLKNKSNQINRNYQYKYKTLINETLDTYNTYCNSSGKYANGTDIIVCNTVKNGTITITREGWEKLTPADLKKGVTIIGIFADTKRGDKVEWVPNIAGLDTPEFATWVSSYNVGLRGYWTLNETTGTLAADSLGIKNLTTTSGHQNSTGVIGYSYSPANEALDTGININGWTGFTLNFWIKRTGNILDDSRYWMEGNAYNSNNGFLFANEVGDAYKVRVMDASSEKTWTSGALSTSAWTMETLVIDVTGQKSYVYENGVNVANFTSTGIAFQNLNIYMFGGDSKTNNDKWDEISIYNRTWSASEVVDAYNGGAGITYIPTTPVNALAVTLNSPNTSYNTSSSAIVFNCSATDETGVLNLTLIINSIDNYTITGGAGQNLSLQISRNIPESNGSWTCRGSDGTGAGEPVTATTRTYAVDTTPPNITINYPVTNEIQTFNNQLNLTANATTSDPRINTCIYGLRNLTGEVLANTSYICNTNVTLPLNVSTNYTLTFWANDTLNNYNSSSFKFFFNLINYTEVHTTSVVEGENITFSLILNAGRIYTSTANFTFNGVNYGMNLITSNSTNAQYTRSLVAPAVLNDTDYGLVYNYSINGIYYNTSSQAISVKNMQGFTIATDCNTSGLLFNLYDEANFTTLSGTFNYLLYYGLSNNTLIYSNGTITGDHFNICFNKTVSTNWSIGYGEIQYYSSGYVQRRYYIFDDKILTDSNETVNLYDLLSSIQTSFKLEVEDTSLNPYTNKYTTLLRWYPEINQYKIVEMGKTDVSGTTVMHVKTEDVDYRVGVYERNGTLIQLDDPTRMICLVNPCTYTFKVSPIENDFTSFLKVQKSLDYNETTGIWTFIYSDPTQKTNTMNLTIYRDTGTDTIAICSSATSGWVGVITCNTSLYTTGTLRAVVTRAASPPIIIAQKIIQLTTTAFNNAYGLWLTILIAIPVTFVFALISPVAAIVGGVVAFLPAFYFGSINIGIFGGIIILGGIIMHFLKRIG